jgi:hypothetical protein
MKDVEHLKRTAFSDQAVVAPVESGRPLNLAGVLKKFLLHLPKGPLFAYLQRIRDAVLKRLGPIGYEDETAFHYGEPGERSEDAGRALGD